MAIKVTLADTYSVHAIELARHAADICYNPDMPVLGKSRKIDVKSRLFQTSHHTTLTHTHITFTVSGVSVNAFTFGLHLASPFYNADQKSGRFSSDMFANPDITPIARYIAKYWKNLTSLQYEAALDFTREGLRLFREYTPLATSFMASRIQEERPHASQKYVDANASKLAQEQLRMVVPTIYPTAADYTLSLIGIVQLWHSAWNPEMRAITDQMKGIVLRLWPEIAYMFDPTHRTREWNISLLSPSGSISFEPKVDLIAVLGNPEDIISPQPRDTHPVDLLHYDPKYMDNNIIAVQTRVNISLATMGQDQRHRTVRRSEPVLTGGFYAPTVVRECIPSTVLLPHIQNYLALSNILPGSLFLALAPYGAEVSYEKLATVNAFAHEMGKRACWCAQEEISNIALKLRPQIDAIFGAGNKLSALIAPPCYTNGGKCTEGVRYCGRNIIHSEMENSQECFVQRTV